MSSVDPKLLLSQTAWLRRLATRLVGDPHVAEDVVQDTWLAALERPPESTGSEAGAGHQVGRLRRWLATVAHNAARMRHRSESRRRAREREVAGAAAAGPPSQSFDEPVIAQQRLLAALMTLPAADREVVVLRFLEDLPPRAIAKRLGTTNSAVRSRLSRALDVLRTRLGARDNDRRALALTLLPLVEPLVATPTPLPTGPSLLTGTLIMNAAGKTALATLAIAITATFAWTWTDRATDPSPNGAPTPSPSVAATSIDEHAEQTATTPSSENDRTAVSTPRPTTAQPKPVTDTTLVVTARCLDENGRPIANAKLTASQVVDRPQAVTDESGRVTLEVPWPAKLTEGNRHWLVLEATAERRIVLSRQERVQGKGKVALALGDLVLGPGAALSGLVRDTDGSPLADARIWVARGTQPANGAVEEARLVNARGFRGLGHGVWAWTNTDATGNYEFDGLPVGSVSVVARHPGRLCAYTAPIELLAGQKARAPELRLAEVPEQNAIRGHVRDSDGRALPGARIAVFENRGPRNIDSMTMATAGQDGAFALTVMSGQQYTLEVTLRGAARRRLLKHDIAAGSLDVVLQFEAARRFELVLTGPDGERLKPTGAFAYDENDRYLDLGFEQGENGERIPLAPNQTFTLLVRARGHLEKRLGPFQPGKVPARIEARLERAGTITGRVLANGRPVAGAVIRAHFVDPRQPMHRFAHKVYTRLGRSSGQTTTDATGSFTLDVHRDGQYVLHADADGHGRGSTTELTLAAKGQAAPVTIALTMPGTITGRVLAGAGESVEGRIVAATRGDGHVQAEVTDDEGRFRFTRLAPGGWQVRICQTDDLEWLRMARTWPEYQVKTLPVDIELAPGQDATFDIDLRARTSAAVAGRLTMAGTPCGGWRVSLWRDGEYLFTKTDDDGRFELHAAAGKTTIYFFSRLPAGGELRVKRRLTLVDGHNTADLEIPAGGLELLGVPPSAAPPKEDRTEGYALVWPASGDRPEFTYRFDPDGSGAHRSTALPAGNAELRRRENDRTYVENWKRLADVQIIANRTASVVLQ
ncbi:MAG: sigma-70 family RNA polymerase sigma factor [bacterium]|nr:sigma-70 family RNA polymerase sigma factor [bacterium]